MGFSTTEVQEFYDSYKAAYLAISTGQSYSINTGGTTRSLTRADLATVKKEMEYWRRELDKASSGRKGIPTKFITPGN